MSEDALVEPLLLDIAGDSAEAAGENAATKLTLAALSQHTPLNADDKDLLLSVSVLHNQLALAPVVTICHQLIEDGEDKHSFIAALDHVAADYKSTAYVWLSLAGLFVTTMPWLYGKFGLKKESMGSNGSEQQALMSGTGFFVGPLGVLVALVIYKVLQHTFQMCERRLKGSCVVRYRDGDKIGRAWRTSCQKRAGECVCCPTPPNWLEVSIFRKCMRQPLLSFFYMYMRAKTPSLQFNNFSQWMGVSDPMIKNAVSLGYLVFVGEILLLGYNAGELGIAMLVAYALGEVYCKGLDYLLAPPASVIAVIKSKLRNAAPDHFWHRLYKNNHSCFALTCAEASIVKQTGSGLSVSVPRHITSIILDESHRSIKWKDVRNFAGLVESSRWVSNDINHENPSPQVDNPELPMLPPLLDREPTT